MQNGEFESISQALDYIAEEARSHVIFQNASDADAIALWVASSYLMDQLDLFPKLLLNSPERECGKSTAIQVIEAFVKNGRIASSITPAAVYRFIQSCSPTLLIDEADRSLKNNEELNAIINAGHNRRTATKMLTVKGSDGDWSPVEMSLWCPQVIAGIGEFEDTLMSRSVVVGLRRKLPTEKVARMTFRYFDYQAKLRSFLERWAETVRVDAVNLKELEGAGNRVQDNWDALLRVAELAGGHWSQRARDAFKVIELERKSDKVTSSGSELLLEIKELLRTETGPEIPSNGLLEMLLRYGEGEWRAANNGRPITSKWLANKLKLYGIRPARRRDHNVYLMADFDDAFSRYLPT